MINDEKTDKNSNKLHKYLAENVFALGGHNE